MQILRSVFKGAKAEKHEDGRTVYRAVATGSKIDRYGEVVMPRGAITESFLKNPVMLRLHNYMEPPVGKVLGLDIEDEKIEFDFVFSADEEGQKLEAKYINKDMNAFSIGFIPQRWVSAWDIRNEDGTYPKTIEVELADGSKKKIDLTKFAKIPLRIYTAWELLEISPVSVPAYADALMIRSLALEERQFEDPLAEEFFTDAVGAALRELEPHLAKFAEEIHDFSFKGAVPKHSTPIVEDAWDGAAARAKLAKWATTDGSGDKEKMNWGKYARGFGYVDEEMKESYAGYKLPHHTVSEGKLVAVKRGVTAAMAALLGARGGTDVGEDGKSVYNHLVGHYKDMEMEPPSYDKSYEEADLKAVADGTWTEPVAPAPTETASVADPTEEIVPAEPPASAVEAGAATAVDVQRMVKEIIEGVFKLLGEYMSDTNVKLNMLHDMVTDLSNQRGAAAPPKTKEDKAAEPSVSITKELQTLLNRHAPLPTGEPANQ